MSRLAVSLLVLGAAVARAAMLAEAIAQAMPTNTERTFVDSRHIVRCADGAVWMTWSQEAKPEYWYKSREDPSKAPDIGLFCRCVGPAGTDIVPPARIVEPVMDRIAHLPDVSSGFAGFAQPDGSLLVLANQPTPLARYTERSLETLTTNVVRVDRGGRTSRLILDDVVNWSRTGRGEQLAGEFCSWHDSLGNLRCIYKQYSGGTSGREGLIRYLTIVSSDSDLKVGATDARYYLGSKDTSKYRGAGPSRAARPDFRWFWGGWDYVAIAPLVDGTLLAVYAVPVKGWHPGLHVPGDSLIIYHLREQDLSVLTTTRVGVASVAGRDYGGLEIPQSVLMRTHSGYVFMVVDRECTKSYDLDRDGNPVSGRRLPGTALSAADCEKASDQLVSVIEPDRGGIPRQVHWFGFRADGRLCHDEYAR